MPFSAYLSNHFVKSSSLDLNRRQHRLQGRAETYRDLLRTRVPPVLVQPYLWAFPHDVKAIHSFEKRVSH